MRRQEIAVCCEERFYFLGKQQLWSVFFVRNKTIELQILLCRTYWKDCLCLRGNLFQKWKYIVLYVSRVAVYQNIKKLQSLWWMNMWLIYLNVNVFIDFHVWLTYIPLIRKYTFKTFKILFRWGNGYKWRSQKWQKCIKFAHDFGTLRVMSASLSKKPHESHVSCTLITGNEYSTIAQQYVMSWTLQFPLAQTFPIT